MLKSPVHAAYPSLLARHFPDAQIVYLHRDPVDAARSLAALLPYLGSVFQPKILPIDAVKRTLYVQQLFSYLMAKNEDNFERSLNLLHVSFADLAKDPAALGERLFAWAGLRVDDDVKKSVRKNFVEKFPRSGAKRFDYRSYVFEFRFENFTRDDSRRAFATSPTPKN